MNGKNLRTRGCWSRGAPSFARPLIQKRAIQQPVPPAPPIYVPPIFTNLNFENLSQKQRELANYFSSYPFITREENFSYNANTPYAIINLRNKDFKSGTVRIGVPGVYRLSENIIFNPNPTNDFMPLPEQSGVNGIYPQHMKGPYHLGFFAAITVECDNVIIDLNGLTIQQSPSHNFQQRFYANIELANAPFIMNKGPANFQGAMQYKAANRVLVYNGKLFKSSHHGIHANTANKVMLYNLSIEDFEVAGIALNGTTTGILSNIYIKNNKQDIKVLSTYSQARFIRSFLDLVLLHDPQATLDVLGNTKSISDIRNKLNQDLNNTFAAFSAGTDLPVPYFNNGNDGYDGNVYGMVLNVNGPAVGAYLTKAALDEMIDPGNTDIYLENIHISNIASHPVEIIGIKNPSGDEGSYGKKMQAGPIGDILQIIQKFVNPNGKYIGTSLSNSQIIISKSSIPNKGTTSITNDSDGNINTVKWVEDQQNLTVLTDECYLVGGGDSMGHIMKGNLGLFISGGKNITGTGIYISGIKNNGQDVGKKLSDIDSYLTDVSIQPESRSKLGSSAVDILLTACFGILFTNTASHLGQPTSENVGAIQSRIEKINDSIAISID